MRGFGLVGLLWAFQVCWAPEPPNTLHSTCNTNSTIWNYYFTDLATGANVTLNQYKGRVIMVVNVATY